MIKKQDQPRLNSIVKATSEYKARLRGKGKNKSILLREKRFVYLGDIPNMKGHCVIASLETGLVHVGYHCDSFEELNENET